MTVYRCFVEKKQPFAVEADGVLNDLRIALRLVVDRGRCFDRRPGLRLSGQEHGAPHAHRGNLFQMPRVIARCAVLVKIPDRVRDHHTAVLRVRLQVGSGDIGQDRMHCDMRSAGIDRHEVKIAKAQ